ncbi:hypothetical protein [Sinomicrobium weinanense]|uniref:Uncharacterized protein n=1 Tax=Sinomicrobium weinanense TaxID=2842200 RepID=A0A926JUZ1_9FLAO|nr:hypothetical protein [Sinomicrobium weinanense]MBC9797960.1 hypothetical protein [Sinomicrobium weinanense]MBU3123104.1 hypothetical protein [Sinomicrobium weinanense]
MRPKTVFLLLFLVLVSCTTPKKTNSDLISRIPENASVIVKIPNPQAFFNALKNNTFLQENALLPPALSRKLEALRFLDKKSEALLCVIRTSDSLYDFTYISRDVENYTTLDSLKDGDTKNSSLNKTAIKQFSSGKHKLFNTVVDSMFISSSSEPLIEESILGKSEVGRENFRKIFALADKDKQASVFLRNHPFHPEDITRTDSTTARKRNAAQQDHWTMFDLSLSPGELLLSGIIPNTDSLPANTSAQIAERKTIGITPVNARGVLSFTPADFSRGDSLSVSPVGDLLASTDEVGIIFGEKYDAVVFHTFDAGVAEKAFSSSAVLNTTFRDHNIYQIDPVGPFSQTLPPFGEGKELMFYTAIENHIVLAHTVDALTDLIVQYQSKSTLNKRTSYTKIAEELPDVSSLLAVGMTPGFKELFLKKLFSGYGKDLSFSVSDNFPYMIVQGVADRNYTHTNILLRKPGSRRSASGISQKFNIALDADVAIPPQLVTNHQNKQKEVVVQDVEHNLYLISRDGKVLWKKKLNGRIIGRIAQVDIFRNGRLQLAFTLSDGLYIVDRNGKDVSPFPVKVKSPITKGLAVFDYDKNKKYRFFITQNNIIVPFNAQGKRVKGFDFKGTQSPIINPPEHIRTGSRDYIAVQEENGNLHLLHRTGKKRVNVKGKIDFSGNKLFFYNGKFTTSNSSGDLVQVDKQGRLNKRQLGLAKDHHIDATSRTLATLSDNILTIKQNKYELDYGIYTQPEIFYIHDKIYVSVTDIQTKKVYLFDSNALLLGHFPVYGTSAIDLADLDGRRNLGFVTQGEKDKVVLYEIK